MIVTKTNFKEDFSRGIPIEKASSHSKRRIMASQSRVMLPHNREMHDV